MAAGFAVTIGEARYNGKLTVYVLISCIVAAMGGAIFGYDIAVSGGVTSMPAFLQKFFPGVFKNIKENNTAVSNYCKYDNQLLTAFTSSLYLAGFVASFFSSWVTRDYGRKPSTLLAGVCFLAGSALNGAAFNLSMLILGRIFFGVGIGFANQAVPLYLSEMAPPQHRGAINSGLNLAAGFGVLSANLVNYRAETIEGGWGWRLSLALVALPSAILTFGAIFLPETPNSIIQTTDDHDKAKKLLQRIRGTLDVNEELKDLVQANMESKSIENPFRSILKRKYRPHLVMMIAFPIFDILTGISIIGFYTPVLLISLGMKITRALLMTAVISGGVGIWSGIITMGIIDRFGRRTLLISGGLVMLLSYTLVGAIMAAKLPDHGAMETRYAYTVLVLMCLYVAGFCWSWGPLATLIPSEILPLEIRSAGQSIVVALKLLMTFVVAQLFLMMLCPMKATIFFFFTAWMVSMTVFMYMFLPETANIPIEKMDGIWKEHWFWKMYVDENDDAVVVKSVMSQL